MNLNVSGIDMYMDSDETRIYDVAFEKFNRLVPEPYRSPFYRDYARLIHSPSFRRLQGKSQLFPGNESDFFRNRLTHSIEVAQIGKSITNRLNWILSGFPEHRKGVVSVIDADLVQFACLAHDLGHPPFGHQGEAELNQVMKHHGGFEGNAQTLRLLSKIEKKVQREISKESNDPFGFSETGTDNRMGLNLTARSLSSILKYDKEISVNKKEDKDGEEDDEVDIALQKGYYYSEKELVDRVKKLLSRGKPVKVFKTVEMQIMDIADDIAYSVYDLEDSLKGGFINGLDLITDYGDIFENISTIVNNKLSKSISAEDVGNIISKIFGEFVKKVNIENLPMRDAIDMFNSGAIQKIIASFAYVNSRNQAKNGYYRTYFTSLLVGKFIRSVNIKLNKNHPAFSKVYIDNKCEIKDHKETDIDVTIEVLKRFTYEFQIQSHKLKLVESRGRDIVYTIFKKLLNSKGAFLPEDYAHIYKRILKIENAGERELQQYRIICDFVASMTDKYAVEFYGRMRSENPQSIFKSI